ncbi:MAG: hypothetical protein IJ849_08330 [Selenomonadaceae bacterium]|nr:hypothetical protein [Selenomonadaceae bacterium]
MKEAGFSQDAAKEFFFKHCPYVRHQPRQQAEELFRQILPSDMKDEVIIRLDKVMDKTLGDIYWQTKDENAENFPLVYQKADMAAINALLDMGFTSRAIDESYELNSFFAAEIENEPLAIDYENEIKRNVTEERELKSLDEGKEAKISLQKISVSNRHKFAGNDKEYALYNNGQTVLALLLQEGFMPETVRAVMESTVKDRDRLEKLMEECGRVKIAYQEIKDAPEIDEAGNMPDTYRAYAKIYMQRHHLNQLSFTDDCQIIKDMKEAEGYPDEFLRNALRVMCYGSGKKEDTVSEKEKALQRKAELKRQNDIERLIR